MKPQKLFSFILLFLPVLFSCKKNVAGNAPPAGGRDTGNIVGIIKEVGEILQEVYQDDQAYIEVNAAILCGYYEDERVMLKDLLFPDHSALYDSEKFKTFNVDTGVFRKIFCRIVEKGNYPLISTILSKPQPRKGPRSKSYVIASEARIPIRPIPQPDTTKGPVIIPDLRGIAIYFPYSENFAVGSIGLYSLKRAAIVVADRDADAGPGKEPYTCSQGTNRFCYKDVIVNDDYADKNPTHIVTMDVKPQVAPPADIDDNTVNRVYHGWSKLSMQMDKLISFTGNGGGRK